MINEEELIHFRGEFINYMKKKHGTIEGRAETLNTLSIHIKKNILQEHMDLGAKEVPENLNELVAEKFLEEFNIILEKIRKG